MLPACSSSLPASGTRAQQLLNAAHTLPPPLPARRCGHLLRLFPGNVALNFLQQEWEGDISLVLPHGVLPIGAFSFNLSREQLRAAMQEMRRGGVGCGGRARQLLLWLC